MSDLGEAVAAVFGLIIGGYLFISIGAQVDPAGPINFTLWGAIFIIVAILAIILIGAAVVGIALSVLGNLLGR